MISNDFYRILIFTKTKMKSNIGYQQQKYKQ